LTLVWRERKVVIILIIIVDSRVVDNDRRRSRRRRGSTASGSGAMHIPTAHSRNEVAARSLIVRARGRPVAMLGIYDGSWGTATAHSNIELVVFVVVTAHLGEASRTSFAQGYPTCWDGGIRAVHAHTLLSGATGPRTQSVTGWTDPALITIGDKA
jgi:hypothetical protein